MFEHVEGCDQIEALLFEPCASCNIEESTGCDLTGAHRKGSRFADLETDTHRIIHREQEATPAAAEIEKSAEPANIAANVFRKATKTPGVSFIEGDARIAGSRGVLIDFVVFIGGELWVSKSKSTMVTALNPPVDHATAVGKKKLRRIDRSARECTLHASRKMLARTNQALSNESHRAPKQY